MMHQLVVGYGQIGKAIGQVIGEHDWCDRDVEAPNKVYVVMHISIPYSEKFVDIVNTYIKNIKPEHVIIYSTLPIGVTKLIERAVHSPIEGKHPELAMSIRQMERWVGYNDTKEATFFEKYFRDLGLGVKLVGNSDYTEALKLLSTTEYGINILFADYKARVAESIGMNYELTKEWNREYNVLYKNLGMDKRFQKFVLDAPGGFIGGHCVVPNAQILNDTYPDEIVKRIGEMG